MCRSLQSLTQHTIGHLSDTSDQIVAKIMRSQQGQQRIAAGV